MSKPGTLVERVRRKPASLPRSQPATEAAKHLDAMGVSDALRHSYRRMYRPQATMIDASEIIELLNKAKVKFVLMGAHAVSGYRDLPRATQDVDFLVQKRQHRKAVTAIRTAYPELEVEDHEVVTRFIDTVVRKSIIDLIKPVELVHQTVFKHTVAVGETHCIPDLEMMLVCKYAAMISLTREDDKKHTDASDFINMVRTNQEKIDSEKLRLLGETVYTGGGAEVVKYVEDIKAGRRLKI